MSICAGRSFSTGAIVFGVGVVMGWVGGLILCQLVCPGVGCPQGYGFSLGWIYLVLCVYCSRLIMLVFV